MKHFGILIGLLLLIAILVAAGWYIVSPLFLEQAVDEPSPFTFPTKGEIGMIMPDASPSDQTKAEQVAERFMPAPTEATTTAHAIVASIEESSAAANEDTTLEGTASTDATKISESQALETKIDGQGNFVDGDAFHKGSGIATLYAAPGGSYLLRFEQFKTSVGPQLHVYLSPHPAPDNPTDLGDYLDLGTLKGNVGDQNYAMPAGFDPTQYKSVVIYCVPFQVIFATATLQ